MTIPLGSNYPTELDTNQNLFQVHDALRLRLSEDYNPGDTSIVVYSEESMMSRFDETGIITLTEQCSNIEERAISFYYGSRTSTTFDNLEILSGFLDSAKPKNITYVTQNVMAEHHNFLTNAVINIQNFAGKKGDAPTRPLDGTMEQRITLLRNLALTPKAWFNVDKNLGLAPLTVTFENQSFRLGTDGTSQEVKLVWDFGDNTGPSIIEIEEDTEVPSNVVDVLVNDTNAGTITKTYTKPGIYSVTLTVTNDFGSDSVTFDDLINAKFPAPDYAVIEFIQRSGQIVTSGTPVGGPYTTSVPTIRATTNSIIDMQINSGINTYTGKTYGGEAVDETNTPIDPIESYTWSLSDDLSHTNSSLARAVYSVGGYYDLNLRVDTKYGAYRITTYENSIDVVEKLNLWLWHYNTGETTVTASEFGLISEVFKTGINTSLNLNRDDSFLTGQNNESQQKREFKRNVGFAQRGSATSGSGGTGLLYWASGRSSLETSSNEEILMSEFNGFTGTYTAKSPYSRPWNWVSFVSPEKLYFILGGVTGSIPSGTSPTNQVKDSMNLDDLIYNASPPTLNITNYKNGAEELTQNEVSYTGGVPDQGHMSVYRSCWHQNAGYLLRNQGVGAFFRIRSFYKTSGNTSEAFQDIRKLPDLAGSARVEGQLVSLSQGVYFFSNSGSVAAYNPTTGIWGTGGPGANSASFRLLQDTSIIGFDDANQTFLCASDGDRMAYLSFDYSKKAFIKFNETDTTFSGVTSRPYKDQWNMTIF
jgi:PKD repeat protein